MDDNSRRGEYRPKYTPESIAAGSLPAARLKERKPQSKPEHQTLKANATPRIGQGTRTRSPYHRAFDPYTRSKYPGQAASYNVGRTRRMA